MAILGFGRRNGVAFRCDEILRTRKRVMEVPETEIQAGVDAFRAMLEESGYSSWVSDEQVRATVIKILEAALAVRAG